LIQLPPPKPVAGDAFEDVLYGSESEIEDSEGESAHEPVSRKKNDGDGARLRLDDEEPMDLLQGATGKITSTSFPSNGSLLLTTFLNRPEVEPSKETWTRCFALQD
jgi:hypothetical protein